MASSEILAAAPRESNADLILECNQLGYIKDDDLVLDPTYGMGVFWGKWRPKSLVGSDLDINKSPVGTSVDFTQLPWMDGTYDVVVFDPPYKLSGTSRSSSDARYGVEGPYVTSKERHKLILDGVTECARVLRKGGYLLVKCQDQVSSGKVHWQTDMVTTHVESLGLRKVDALLFVGMRPQPAGRRQVHARRNYSTLLVFKKDR